MQGGRREKESQADDRHRRFRRALLFLERPDLNGVNTVEMSTMKAKTAALRGRPSSAFAKRVQEKPGSLMAPNYLGVDGGVPLIYENECVGGVGVSGIDHDDELVAIAGAEAFGQTSVR